MDISALTPDKQVKLQYWLDVIRQCRASGLTNQAWCEQHHISLKSYYYWIAKIRKLALEELPRKSHGCRPVMEQTALIPDAAPELAAYVVMALEENPEQDFLGSIFMELNLGDKSNSQFFTPYHVCELMAKVTEEDVAAVVKEKGYITINDFCCGAGATLIAAINEARKQLEKVNLNFQNHVLVVAQDIDEIVALMCYIQLSLLGVAAYIKVGDVFTQPMSTDDNGENYWFTMMYFSDVWTMRRVFHSL